MEFSSWSAVVGVLLIVMALADSVLARLPLSTSMLYLAVGLAASPLWLGWAALSPAANKVALEHVAEVVVLLSLFASGLKMGVGLGDGRWLLPLRLALVSMLITVLLVAFVGVQWLGLSLGAAVLLGGILAPTDPVLASDVQVANADDRDRLRFALTGEAGLNDGTAYPVVLFGLALLGLNGGIVSTGWGGFALEVAWGAAGGLVVGAALGSVIGRLVLYMRRVHRKAVGLDNFLALGLIGLAYGLAIVVHGYGFLAVFAAGVALRRVEQRETLSTSRRRPAADRAGVSQQAAAAAHADPDATHAEQVATHPEHAPAFMAHAMLSFNEQVERVGEMVAVVAIGMLLWALPWSAVPWWFVAVMLLAVRPLSVALGLVGSRSSLQQRGLMAWFGIRGIGSFYYLMFALNRGLDDAEATRLATITFAVVVASIVVHGISVTPLMALYDKARPRARTRG